MSEQLTDVTIKRTKCPFYGFYFFVVGKSFMDQRGNQCALIGDSYSPCQMEITKQFPDLDKCSIASINIKTVEEAVKTCSIAPGELWPKDKTSWSGISFRAWYDHIMFGKNLK